MSCGFSNFNAKTLKEVLKSSLIDIKLEEEKEN
jgi:hypothetical protein